MVERWRGCHGVRPFHGRYSDALILLFFLGLGGGHEASRAFIRQPLLLSSRLYPRLGPRSGPGCGSPGLRRPQPWRADGRLNGRNRHKPDPTACRSRARACRPVARQVTRNARYGDFLPRKSFALQKQTPFGAFFLIQPAELASVFVILTSSSTIACSCAGDFSAPFSSSKALSA